MSGDKESCERRISMHKRAWLIGVTFASERLVDSDVKF